MHHSFYASMQLLQQPQMLVKKGWKFLVVLLLGLMVVAGSLGGVLSIFIGESESSTDSQAPIGFYGGNVGLSPETEQYRSMVQEVLTRYGIPEYESVILAIIQVESKGLLADVMQSSESAGLAPNAFTNPLQSIEQGVKYMKANIDYARERGVTDVGALLMGYNFGTAYIQYIARNGGVHTLELAEQYSKNIVAPSLGNTTGITMPYRNAISEANGKPYIYYNGGNFHYADLVGQYLVAGTGNQEAINGDVQHLLDVSKQYLGVPYVWGGKTPNGWDCSGFVGWVYKEAWGIEVSTWTVTQALVGERIPVSEAKAGDMLFWGPTGAETHVAIYLGDGTFIHAPQPGDVTKITPLQYFQPDFAVRM